MQIVSQQASRLRRSTLASTPGCLVEAIQKGVRAADFDTTQWTLVMTSAQSQTEEGRAALAELCRLYWYPLYFFARHRGHSPHDAQDATQGFFLHLLEHRALTRVDRLKGKFRSFLLASFRNYLSMEVHRACSIKRGGKCEFVSLDLESAENCYLSQHADQLTPEKIFDARWAITLLGRAMTLLSEEYAAKHKSSTFEALKGFLGIGDTKDSPAPKEAAKALGISLGTVKTLIHRIRKRYSSILRREIGRTVSEPAEIDGEIHALCDAIIAAEGRITYED